MAKGGWAQPANSIQELKREVTLLRSGWSGETRANMRMLLWLCEQFEKYVFAPAKKRTNRRPSSWNLFFGAGVRAGKSPRQIAEEWKKKKAA